MPMLTRLIEPLHGIPRHDDDFVIPAVEAARQFGCGTEVLDTLREAGLIRGGKDGAERFALCDLHYIGVRTGTASQYLWAMHL
jgi:hypothetical protein